MMPVYMIQVGEDGPVKIGHGKHPLRRMHNLQCGSVEPLRLIGMKDGSEAEERVLHLRYRDQWIRGEWFHFLPEMLDGFSVEPTTPRRRVQDDGAPEFVPIDEIHRRAKAAGLRINRLCEEAGIARSTYERWRIELPATLESYQRLLQAVAHAEDQPS